jgi:hypothetical protein
MQFRIHYCILVDFIRIERGGRCRVADLLARLRDRSSGDAAACRLALSCLLLHSPALAATLLPIFMPELIEQLSCSLLPKILPSSCSASASATNLAYLTHLTHRLSIAPISLLSRCSMVNIRRATIHDLVKIQQCNLQCLPENYTLRFAPFYYQLLGGPICCYFCCSLISLNSIACVCARDAVFYSAHFPLNRS